MTVYSQIHSSCVYTEAYDRDREPWKSIKKILFIWFNRTSDKHIDNISTSSIICIPFEFFASALRAFNNNNNRKCNWKFKIQKIVYRRAQMEISEFNFILFFSRKVFDWKYSNSYIILCKSGNVHTWNIHNYTYI